jgi:uncharacterized protein YegP (UPF0339 family)
MTSSGWSGIMEFRVSEARLRELAQIEADANCVIGAGGGWDQHLARVLVNQDRQDASAIFEIYQDAYEQYRWRCRTATGQMIAESSEGYQNRTDCEAGIRWMQDCLPTAQIVA